MTADLPEGDNPAPVFQAKSRIRIREDYIDSLDRGQRKFAGRCGEILSIDGHRIDIVMDRDKPRAQQTILTLFTLDGLEPAPPDSASWQPKPKPEKVMKPRTRNVACPRSVVKARSGS